MDPRHMWSTEELQHVLDELAANEDPDSAAEAVAASLRVPLEECRKLIKVVKSAFQRMSDSEAEKAGRRKRFRRKAALIERSWFCYMPGCTKSYGTENALKNHFKNKHKSTNFDKAVAQKHSADEERRRDGSDMADSGNADGSDDDLDVPQPPPEKVRKIGAPPEEAARFYPAYTNMTTAGPTGHWVAVPPLHMTQMTTQFYAARPPELVAQPFSGPFAIEIPQTGSWQRPWPDGSISPEGLMAPTKSSIPLPPINAVMGPGPQFAAPASSVAASPPPSAPSSRRAKSSAAASSTTSSATGSNTGTPRRRRSPPSK